MKKINIRESLLNMDRETDCKYDLTSLYESVKLDDEKKKQLCQYIDKVDIDATNRFLSNEAASQGLMENASDDISDDQLQEYYDTEGYTEVASKQVPDMDGFLTDYTMYIRNEDGWYVCVFGDKDIYGPDYYDWECETEEEAWEWFNDYKGFEDEEESSTDELLDSLNESSINLTQEQKNKVFEIADRYCTSKPVSGSWETEEEHERKAIAKELNISEEDASKIMVQLLGFNESLNESKEVEILENVDAIKLKENWEEFDINDYGNDEIITVVIIDKRFDPMFKSKHKEALKRNNVKIDGHYFNGTVVTGKVSDIIQVCDECCVMNPSKIFMESLALNENQVSFESLNESPDLIPIEIKPDNRKWQYSIGGKDVPYTEYDEAKAHFKDEFDITDYRDELNQFIRSHKGYEYRFDVDVVRDNGEDKLYIDIPWGDWKHEHWAADHLVQKFFMDKGLIVDCDSRTYEEDGSDTYSAEHFYSLNDFVLSGRVIESLNEDKPWLTDKEWDDEFNSVSPDHNDVLLKDNEFHDMYELGYTLGTSTTGRVTKASRKDYDQYKSGKDVNGNDITRDDSGEIIRVYKNESINELMTKTGAVYKQLEQATLDVYAKGGWSEETSQEETDKLDKEAAKVAYDLYTPHKDDEDWDRAYRRLIQAAPFLKFEESLNEAWTDAYEQFNAIVDKHFPNELKIELAVEKLYSQHKGEPDWDEAYRRWYEDIGIDIEDIDIEDTDEESWVIDGSDGRVHVGFKTEEDAFNAAVKIYGNKKDKWGELPFYVYPENQFDDDDDLDEDINEDEITTVTFTFDPSQWIGNPNNLEDYFEYSPEQLTFNPSTVDGPTQVEMTGTLRYINDFKSKYSDLFESLAEPTKIATNSKGDYLVQSEAGGYTAFNKYDVCIGGIDSEDEQEAKNKFMSGKLDESLVEDAFDNFVRYDKDGEVVSTNSQGYKLVRHNDAGLSSDVFNWSVIDSEGNPLFKTGRLYYGYDISWTDPFYRNTYGDAIVLKCIADKYNFNDNDILSFLSQNNRYSGLKDRYAAACGTMSPDLSYGWYPQSIEKALMNIPNEINRYNNINESVSKQTLDEGWFSDDDFEDDMMHTDLYGGDPMYCRTCGSKIDYSDGYGFCPQCNPQDDELEYVGEESIVDPDDLELVSNRFNPDDPGFDEYDLREGLEKYSQEQISYVYNCYKEVCNEVSKHYEDESGEYTPQIAQIKRDYLIGAFEDDLMTDDEFNDIYSQIESKRNVTEALKENKTVAVAFDTETPDDYSEKDVEDTITKALDKTPVKVSGYMEVHSLDEDLTESLNKDPNNKDEVIAWLSDHDQAWEDITDFFGSNDLSEIELDSIIDWISNHEELDIDFARYFGLLDELNEDLRDDLDKRYRPSSINLRYLDKLRSSELIKSLEVVLMYDNEVVELTATDGRVFYLVPSTLSQFDVYDEQENLVATNLFTSEIPNELLETGEPNYTYQVVGGDYAGMYTREELEALPCFSGEYTEEYRTVRSELANQPILDGYLSPMFNGWRENHTACIRYETQEVYNMMSEAVDKHLSDKKGTLGNLIASNNDLIKTFSTKEDIINFLIDIEPQCTDKKYLNQIKMKVIHAKNFYAAYQLLYNAMLKGDGLGSIEKEIRGTKKFAYESLDTNAKDVYTMFHYIPGSLESGIDGDSFDAVCSFFANSLEDAKQQVQKFDDLYNIGIDSYYVQQGYWDNGEEVYSSLEAYYQDIDPNEEWPEIPFTESLKEEYWDPLAVQYTHELQNVNIDINDKESAINELINNWGFTPEEAEGLYNRILDYNNEPIQESAKALTYKELIDLALEHYNEGGDGVYECWDERVFNDYVKSFGPITKSKALNMFKLNYDIDNEERAAARYFSGELEESTQSIKCPVNGLYDGKEDNCFYFKDGQCTLPRDGGKPSEECEDYREWEKTHSLTEDNEEETSEEDDIKEVEQKYKSAGTAVNGPQGKLPAVFKMINIPKGALVLDYGGGKPEAEAVAQAYLDQFEATEALYDPYNQTPEHNKEVIKQCRQNGGADIAVCSNVLNVIMEPEARLNVLNNIKKLTKPSGKVYITVYEGSGEGAGKVTQKDNSYQNNIKTENYLEEVQQVFPDAKRKGKLIFGTASGKAIEESYIKEDADSWSFDKAVDWLTDVAMADYLYNPSTDGAFRDAVGLALNHETLPAVLCTQDARKKVMQIGPRMLASKYSAKIRKNRSNRSLTESSDENWAVFATDVESGKEYCAGVYESRDYAGYWAAMDHQADIEYGYGDFKYRVEEVSDYTNEMVNSQRELNALKLDNYDKAHKSAFE